MPVCRSLRVFASVALVAVLAGCAASRPRHLTPLSLIPMPAHVERAPGHFTVQPGASLRVQADDPAAMGIAHRFAALVERTRGIRLDVRPAGRGGDPRAAIVLDLDPGNPQAPGGEGYRLSVDAHGIRIAARDPRGLFYGTVTLWQLLTPDASRAPTAVVPDLVIDDRPRFAWRGLMLDSARHFQSVADIKQLIDWMALHKLNTLHWHLTDDQGWRLQIKRYPKLTSIGACRPAIGPDAAVSGGPGKPYCGFYTQDQVRDLVRYAAARYITIVPEIEMPGHAQAALAAYPQLGVTGRRPPVSTEWGISTWLYAPNERSLAFLEHVLDEVMALFPSTYIHVGGDEAAKDQWQASPVVQAQLHRLGLKDDDALQGWMVGRIGAYLHAHGRRLIGWDEILDGGVPPTATVMSWRGVDGAIAAANQGHDVVLSPAPTLYLDHVQSDAHDEPPARPLVESLKDIYDFDPVPAAIDAAQAKHVLGAQLNLWTEYMPTFARDQHAIFPRLAALAEVTWSPASAHDWPGFLARVPAQLARYRALGIAYADSAFAPRFALAPAGAGKIAITLSNQTGSGTIRYTTDGTAPTMQSPRYAVPLMLPAAARTSLRAATFAADGFRLAAPRHRTIAAAALRIRNSDQLATCTDTLSLRIEDDRPLDGPRPVYKVDIMNPCWQWKRAPLAGMRHLAVTVGNLPWNYGLWKDTDKVVTRPAATPAGELEVHLDTCDGPRLARIPLAGAATSALQTTLHADLPALDGDHALCLFFTGDPRRGVLWAIDTVALSP
jgi:hexosaminidase